jgi:hypothetical protein
MKGLVLVLLYSAYWPSYKRLINEKIFTSFSVIFGLPPLPPSGQQTEHFVKGKMFVFELLFH